MNRFPPGSEAWPRLLEPQDIWYPVWAPGSCPVARSRREVEWPRRERVRRSVPNDDEVARRSVDHFGGLSKDLEGGRRYSSRAAS